MKVVWPTNPDQKPPTKGHKYKYIAAETKDI